MKNAILILLLALVSRINAQTTEIISSDKTGWHLIGEKTVDFTHDQDEITVLGASRFATLKLFVKDAAINVYEVEVYYTNGDKQVMQVSNTIQAGGESKALDLKGRENDIKRISFTYQTKPNAKDEKAKIEIWGRKSNVVPNVSPVEVPGVVVSDKTGWHKIGERTINWKMDHDEIAVVGADRFASLKFRADFASIDLRSIEIFFENGENQNIRIENPIMMGTESKIVDLKGNERRIKKIVFVYKTLSDQREEKALIEVWGYKTNEEKK